MSLENVIVLVMILAFVAAVAAIRRSARTPSVAAESNAVPRAVRRTASTGASGRVSVVG